MMRKRRVRSRPMQLRHVATRERIARLLLLGWTGERIAERLNCSTRQVRYAVATPEFQTLFDHLQKEHFKALDQKMHRLLHGAVTALHRQLKHPDWRARDAAIEKVLRVHGRYVEKLDLTGQVDHQHRFGVLPEAVMTDEMRHRAARSLGVRIPRPPPLNQPVLAHRNLAAKSQKP
jgi:hypothetical protein